MITVFDFHLRFPDETSCFDYLYDLKWSNGFLCPRCKHTEAYNLKKRNLKQCKNCKYQESVIAGTIFHNIRLPLLKIIWACFWIATTKKGISALELQRKLGIKSYGTAWLLCHKIRKAMKSSDKFPIEGDVEIDETFLGLSEKPDDDSRALISVVVETDGTTIGRAYLEHFQTHKSVEVEEFMDRRVVPGVVVKSDGHVSYKFLKEKYQHCPHKMYDKKDNDKHLPKVHIVITNLKNWLRGTYNSMPNKHAQLYLNEFCFRFNRRWNIENIFEKIIARAISTPTVTFAELTG